MHRPQFSDLPTHLCANNIGSWLQQRTIINTNPILSQNYEQNHYQTDVLFVSLSITFITKKQLEAMLQLIRKEDQNEGANTEYAGAITTTPKTPTFAAGWIFCPCDVCVRHSKDTWHDLWD